MPKVERNAQITWEGTLFKGSGKIASVGSGAIGELPITWASRTGRSEGQTSPEELIAAAHAACYAMSLSNTLAQAGTPSQHLSVSAVCTIEQVGAGFKITTMDLTIQGKAPGLDQAGFEAAAHTAEQGCPVSNALRNNVEIRLTAQLVQ